MLLQSTQKLPYPYSFKNTNNNIEIINFFIQMNEVREDDYQICCSSWKWGFLWMLRGNVFRRLQLKCKTYTSNWLLFACSQSGSKLFRWAFSISNLSWCCMWCFARRKFNNKETFTLSFKSHRSSNERLNTIATDR